MDIDESSHGVLPGAVRIEPAFADPAAVLDVVRGAGEYWPLARYAGSADEVVATGGDPATAAYVPPWFRRDMALGGEVLVAGAEVMLAAPAFVQGAHQVFGPHAVIEPSTVYVNVMMPSVAPFVPHVDVPAFRGLTRADHPVWLLQIMLLSGLFEPWRVRLATAVSWFYDGPGGAFHYWPAGPDGPSEVVNPPFRNVAVLSDNERTYHGVAPVGDGRASFVTGLTRDSSLHRVDGGWEMRDDGAVVGRADDGQVRITVSWKAEVFVDEAERRAARDGTDDLGLERVVDMLCRDLARRGTPVEPPEDPHHDRAWVRLLSETYRTPGPRVPA